MALRKVVFYLAFFGGVGFAALKFAETREADLKKELEPTVDVSSEAARKRKLMMDALRAAANPNQPIRHLDSEKKMLEKMKSAES